MWFYHAIGGVIGDNLLECDEWEQISTQEDGYIEREESQEDTPVMQSGNVQSDSSVIPRLGSSSVNEWVTDVAQEPLGPVMSLPPRSTRRSGRNIRQLFWLDPRVYKFVTGLEPDDIQNFNARQFARWHN